MSLPPIDRRTFITRTGSTLSSALALPSLTSFALAQQRNAIATPETHPTEALPPITHILAGWAVQNKAEDVPEPAQKEAIRSILNWVGVAIGGANEPAVQNAVAALLPYANGGRCGLFGRRESFDPLRASLLSGISSHVLDFDDADLSNLIHPAGPVASALFSLAQDRPVTGAEFLHAFIIGTEVENRLGDAVYPSHYEMGWHITGTCGVFGAAAACGRILNLSVEQMTWALGLAATQASGLKIMFGSMAKSFHPGHAAEGGMLAALLAQKNFTASEQAIEGKEGYVYAASTHHDYSGINHNLGSPYSIIRNGYKPFPCGIVLHTILDGMIQIYDQYHPRPDEVQSIAIRANPLVLQLTGKKTPQSELEAKFSVYHAAGVSLVYGRGGVKEFSDAAVKDPAVIHMRSLVHVETDPSIRSDETFIRVTLQNGRVLDKHVEHALGTLQNPMNDKQLEAKFRSLCEDILPTRQQDDILYKLRHLPSLPDASTVVHAARIT